MVAVGHTRKHPEHQISKVLPSRTIVKKKSIGSSKDASNLCRPRQLQTQPTPYIDKLDLEQDVHQKGAMVQSMETITCYRTNVLPRAFGYMTYLVLWSYAFTLTATTAHLSKIAGSTY